MSETYDKRAISTLSRFTAEWINRNMPTSVLVTVTNFRLSRDHKNATVYVSVLPETKEKEVSETFRRLGHDLHDYLDQNVRTRHIPFVSLQIDYGEKNRRQLENIIKQTEAK